MDDPDPNHHLQCVGRMFTGVHTMLKTLQGRPREVGEWQGQEGQIPVLEGEVLSMARPGIWGRTKRMKFISPGEEVPCSFCGQL